MGINELEYYLNETINNVRSKRNRLIVVLEKKQLLEQALTNLRICQVNLNFELSQKLMEVPVNKRSRMIGIFINDIIKTYGQEILAFKDYELLFLPELSQEPLRLFEELSKERTIIIPWSGKYEAGKLYYAEPWHREYREYRDIDAEILNIN